jgi:hypothetical protein
MRLIGLNGFKRSGKNTVGEIIDQACPDQSVKLVGFADKLKIAAARALGYESPELTELVDLMDTFKEHGSLAVKFDGDIDLEVSGREFLQRFGTEACRETFWDSFWIDLVLPDPKRYDEEDKSDRYDELLEERFPGYDLLVVTDVRFPNEAKRIKHLGGEVWEIIRPGVSAGIHASEHPLPRDLVDVTIVNDGTILDLQDEVDRVLFP